MYRKLTALALLTAAACIGTTAQANDVTGWFINGGAGSAHYKASDEAVSGKDSDTAFQITGGWRSQFIGVEGGYVDLGGVRYDDGAGDSLRATGKGWTVGLNGHFNPTDKRRISARAGFFAWTVHLRADLTGTGGATRFTDNEHAVNGYAGIGTGVDFNRHWSLGVNFDYYQMKKYHAKINTKTYTVNLEYRF